VVNKGPANAEQRGQKLSGELDAGQEIVPKEDGGAQMKTGSCREVRNGLEHNM